ncbi:MAG: IS66-like element accessory protein TnpA [Rhodopila sp.]
MADAEIVARVERRRKWTMEEKAALVAEVEAEGGKVRLVARRHRVSESLLYNWRSAWKAAAAIGSSGAVAFVPLGVLGETDNAALARLPAPEPPRSRSPGGSRAGAIEIALPNGSRVSVDAFVNEKALSRVLRAMKGST